LKEKIEQITISTDKNFTISHLKDFEQDP